GRRTVLHDLERVVAHLAHLAHREEERLRRGGGTGRLCLRRVDGDRRLASRALAEREEVGRRSVGEAELEVALVATRAIVLVEVIEQDARTEAVDRHLRLRSSERQRLAIADHEARGVRDELRSLPRLALGLAV